MSIRRIKSQSGVSLISALFLLVVVSLLGGYMVNLSLLQQVGTTMTLQSVKARYAAQAGIEWTLFQIANTPGWGCGASTTSFSVDGYSVTISNPANTATCDAYPITEGSTSYTLYDVESTATKGSVGSIDHVQWTLRATLSD